MPSYEELLKIDNSTSVHHRNTQIFANDLYKIVNGLSPDTMKDVSLLNNSLSYNTRNRRTFHSRPKRSITYDFETLSHRAPKIWELIPTHINYMQSVATFKSAFKKWKPTDCPCQLCWKHMY